MVNQIGQWIQAVINRDEPYWLTMLGPSGTGKTYCAKRLWHWITHNPPQFDAGRRVLETQWNPIHIDFTPRFISWPKFVEDHLRKQDFSEFDDMSQWPFLVLDEIGAERDNTGFASEQLCTLLNERMRRWTILTSNMGFQQVSTLDTRIADRMIRDKNRYGFIELSQDVPSYAMRSHNN